MGSKSKKASYEIFENACTKLDLSPQQLSDMIGYTRTSFGPWKQSGEMPAVAALAIEGLLRRTKTKKTAVLKGRFEVISSDTEVDIKEVAPGIWVIEV